MMSLIQIKGSLTKTFKTTSDSESFTFCVAKMRYHIKILTFWRSLQVKVVTWSHSHYFGPWWWNEVVQLHLPFSAVRSDYSAFTAHIQYCWKTILCFTVPWDSYSSSLVLGRAASLWKFGCRKGTGPCPQSPAAGRGHAVSTGCFWVKCQLQKTPTLINTTRD